MCECSALPGVTAIGGILFVLLDRWDVSFLIPASLKFHGTDASFPYGKDGTGLFSLAFLCLTAESLRRLDVRLCEAENSSF